MDLANQYINHLNQIIQTYHEYIQRIDGMPDRVAYSLLTRSQAAIEKVGGIDSPYTRQSESILLKEYHIAYKVDLLIGVVEALRDDIHGGLLTSFSELIHGEVFQDFITMADYLCQEGFKDAAAVIAGSTLEAHLKQLSHKNKIDVTFKASDGSIRPKKASQINQDLGKSSYSLFDQKQVNAWLDLRNSAAHGNYDDYSALQVNQFIEWLKDFTSRNPA